MTDCRLTISSRGKGWESNIVRPAKMHIEDGRARVEYNLDGDACTFTLRPGRAEQVRKGGVNLRMTFVPGQKTACIIGDEALRGGYAIFTSRLDCTVGSLGVNAELEYFSGEDKERIVVKLRALANKK